MLNSSSPNELNCFVYCSNNPTNYSDHFGNWIQFAVGAVIGGLLNSIFYVIDCNLQGKKTSTWKIVCNFLNGAINGIVAASGASLIWQIIAGIAGGLVSLFIGAGSPTFEDVIIAIISGVLSGVLAGTLSIGDNKHINYLVKNFGKKISKNFFKSSFGKILLKALKYLFKNCKTILWKFIHSYCIPNTLINAVPRIKTALGV